MQHEQLSNHARDDVSSEQSSWDNLQQVKFNAAQSGEIARNIKRKIGEKVIRVVSWLSRKPADSIATKNPSYEQESLEPRSSKPDSTEQTVEQLDERTSDRKEQDEALLMAMDEYRTRKSGELRNERTRELTERNFNDTMTTPNDLEEASTIGEVGISKREIEYQGKKITVYELTGYPIRFLQHVIDYKEPGSVGYDKSNEVAEDPSKWDTSTDDINSDDTYAGRNISTSYIDADINLERNGGVHSERGIIYGFSHIPDNSLVKAVNGDASTAHSDTDNHITSEISPADFASFQGNPTYNEVAIKRYDEKGKTLRPDFMITHDRGFDKRFDQITESTLQHAAHFGIPIICIHDQAYRDRAIASIQKRVEAVSEDMPYSELSQVINSTNCSNMFVQDLFSIKTRFTDETTSKTQGGPMDFSRVLPDETREELRHLIEDIEPKRRIDYLESSLASAKLSRDDRVSIKTTTLRRDEYQRPIYGEQISLKIHGTPETVVRSDSAEYPRIKAALEKYLAQGGAVQDDRINHGN